jgi:LPS-assembly protein
MCRTHVFNAIKPFITVSFLILLVLMYPFVVDAAHKQGKSQSAISIKTADRQEIFGDTYTATGNVEITWGGYRIYAEYLEFNQKTRKITAKGRVTMTSKETVITGEKLTFDLKSKTGEIYDTYGQLDPTVRYTTDQLSSINNDTLAFKKMDFTPCSQCKPRWKITCSKGKIKKEKYIEVKHALFKIKNIPVMYLPFLRYPLNKNGRSSGFLFPVIGSSSKKGFYVLNAFYWAIKPNIDLTLGIDYYANGGLGLEDEFRYLSKHMDGNIKFYYFKYKKENTDNTQEPGKTSDFDYFFKVNHNQTINFLDTKTRIILHTDTPSDPNFMRWLSSNFNNLQKNIFRSSVSIATSIRNLKFSISASQNDTFNVSKNLSSIERDLPMVTMNLNQQKIWKMPGYFSLYAAYSSKNWAEKSFDVEATSGDSEAEEATEPKPGISSTRLSFKPSYSVNLLKFPWLSASLKLNSSHDYYLETRDPEAEDLVVLDTPLYLQHQAAALTLKGPVFSRVFQLKTSKMKHLIEPTINFRYTTGVKDEDRERLVKPKNYDFSDYSYVGFSLKTRLLLKSGKSRSSAREVLSYTISQDYYFDPELANKDRKIKALDLIPEFSQLSNTLRVRPLKNFSLDATANYNHYLKRFTRILFTLGYNNQKSVLTGNFKYAKSISQYNFNVPDIEYRTETIGGSLNFTKPGFPLKFKTRVDYDIEHGRFSYRSFVLSYDYQCIIFTSGLEVLTYISRSETKFIFGVSFGNLGMVKNLL